MCRCRNDEDYCDDWDDGMSEPVSGKYQGVAWGLMLLIVAAFWSLLLSSCATWSGMSGQQKHDAALAYYSTFSAGLKMSCALVPIDKQSLCSAAIGVADVAIDRLGQAYQSKIDAGKLEVEAAAKVEAANAVVGAM